MSRLFLVNCQFLVEHEDTVSGAVNSTRIFLRDVRSEYGKHGFPGARVLLNAAGKPDVCDLGDTPEGTSGERIAEQIHHITTKDAIWADDLPLNSPPRITGWSGAEGILAHILNCKLSEVQFILDQLKRLDIYYCDVLDYMHDKGIQVSASSFIAEMQNVIVYRAHAEVADDPSAVALGNEKPRLQTPAHYIAISDPDSATILVGTTNILRDFGEVKGQAAIDILESWKGNYDY